MDAVPEAFGDDGPFELGVVGTVVIAGGRRDELRLADDQELGLLVRAPQPREHLHRLSLAFPRRDLTDHPDHEGIAAQAESGPRFAAVALRAVKAGQVDRVVDHPQASAAADRAQTVGGVARVGGDDPRARRDPPERCVGHRRAREPVPYMHHGRHAAIVRAAGTVRRPARIEFAWITSAPIRRAWRAVRTAARLIRATASGVSRGCSFRLPSVPGIPSTGTPSRRAAAASGPRSGQASRTLTSSLSPARRSSSECSAPLTAPV